MSYVAADVEVAAMQHCVVTATQMHPTRACTGSAGPSRWGGVCRASPWGIPIANLDEREYTEHFGEACEARDLDERAVRSDHLLHATHPTVTHAQQDRTRIHAVCGGLNSLAVQPGRARQDKRSVRMCVTVPRLCGQFFNAARLWSAVREAMRSSKRARCSVKRSGEAATSHGKTATTSGTNQVPAYRRAITRQSRTSTPCLKNPCASAYCTRRRSSVRLRKFPLGGKGVSHVHFQMYGCTGMGKDSGRASQCMRQVAGTLKQESRAACTLPFRSVPF